MSLTTIPDQWNSAHRPIEYRYTLDHYVYNNVGDSAGFANMQIPAGVNNFTVGQRVFIAEGLYVGNWTVTAITSRVQITAPFIGSDVQYMTPLVNIAATLWAGYAHTHEGYTDHPYRKIADILGIPGLNGYVPFDVSGYLKSLFKKVEYPRIGADFRMSVPFELRIVGEQTSTLYVLNGTFEQVALQNYNVDFAILNAREPIHFVDGICTYSMINSDKSVHGEHIVNIVGTHGVGNIGGLGFDEIGTTFTVA